MDILLPICMRVTRDLLKTPVGSTAGVKSFSGAFFPQKCPVCGTVAGMNPYTGAWSRHGTCTFSTAEVLHMDHAH